MEERERETSRTREEPKAETSGVATGTGRQAQTDSDADSHRARLDVSSDHFDPLLALYSPDIPLPYPNVKCFNNLAEYESFLKGGRGRAKPENVEKKNRKSKKGVPDPERIERLKKLMVNNPASEEEGGSGRKRLPRRAKAPKNVLTRMPLHAGSPLGELHRCVKERLKIKVHIRTFKGLRGVCSGFLVAFDKFWNMALVDVDETYRKPVLGKAFYHEPALTITRIFDRLKLQESESPEFKKPDKTLTKESDASPGTRKEDKPGMELRRSPRKSYSYPKGQTYTKPAEKRAAEAGEERKTQKGASTESETGKVQKKAKDKPTVDYQQVHCRHVNQLFIRGENILLVNLLE
ncbi:U7 snRNA-associated Sm-like protein LSm11 [Acipenser ruthenus]|uniref:U7 snRNA-associated Sm-like protein LSm11 n=1 Tax=Acipenser ruthenus TaxID=7906 RepID=A0A444UWR7_ACIRT|nr:U7 snRNA-associated Sm-like protein LSm11 [Acipenser ruthenus]